MVVCHVSHLEREPVWWKGFCIHDNKCERSKFQRVDCIRYSSLRPGNARDPQDRLGLVSEGTLDLAPPLLNRTHWSDQLHSRQAKWDIYRTVPTDVDTGHVRPRHCADKGNDWRGIAAVLTVRLRHYPCFLLAKIFLNKHLAGSSWWALIMSFMSLNYTSLQGFTLPPGFVYLL